MLLAIVMVAGRLPNQGLVTVLPAAEIVGGKKYEPLQKAFSAVTPGPAKTAHLLCDIQLTKAVAISRNITLNLNGHEPEAPGIGPDREIILRTKENQA